MLEFGNIFERFLATFMQWFCPEVGKETWTYIYFSLPSLLDRFSFKRFTNLIEIFLRYYECVIEPCDARYSWCAVLLISLKRACDSMFSATFWPDCSGRTRSFICVIKNHHVEEESFQVYTSQLFKNTYWYLIEVFCKNVQCSNIGLINILYNLQSSVSDLRVSFSVACVL
jgi:hypothetical protein